jgi:hypothetical protein
MIERSPATTAHIILDAVRAEFQAAGVDLPLRQYLAIGGRGETVHDCAQVTVSWEMTYSGTPGQPSQTAQPCDNMPLSATYFVEVVRKYPVTTTGKAVSQDLLTAYAEQRMDDSILLAQAGKRAIEAVWSQRGLVDIVAGSPQGEYQALILSIITAV